MNSMLLESRPKCTLINRFDGSFLAVGPGGKQRIDSFMAIEEVQEDVEKHGWTIGSIHPPFKKVEEG